MKKITLITILIICFLFFLPKGNILALTASEIRKQIENTNDQITEIDKQIAKYQQQIAQTAEEKNTLNKLIKELSLTRDKLVAEKNKTQKKINATGLIINELNSNINIQELSILNSKRSLARILADIYINDNYSLAEKLLSEKTLAESSLEYNNILAINEKLQDNLKKVKFEKEKLIISKDSKLTEQEKLEILKKNLTLQQQAVETTKKEKDKVLTITKNKEVEYQKILAEQLKRKESFEKEMEDYETQLKLLINPKFLPKEGSEVLSWPLRSIIITSMYGFRTNPFNTYIKTFHYGVDFRAVSGSSVFAMAGGIIEGTGNTDVACQGASFGKWVLIKHNNGLSSIYAHLSAISVKKGDSIKNGEVLGLSGGIRGVFGSGSSTGPHLHISTYASDGVEIASFESKSCPGKTLIQPRITRADAHLNPLLYLPKTTKAMFK